MTTKIIPFRPSSDLFITLSLPFLLYDLTTPGIYAILSLDDISKGDIYAAMNKDLDILEFLPLTEATYFILLSLSAEPSHGYAIMKDVEVLSGGRVIFSTSTLYTALKRLLESQWIERVPEEDAGGRERKPYALTRLGGRVLQAEVVRLGELLSAAELRQVEGRA
jgi:DNA-binding PadR family transcriptional regulator